MSMGAGSSVSLKKAISNDDVAGKLFDEIDANNDGQLTIVEVSAEFQKMHARASAGLLVC